MVLSGSEAQQRLDRSVVGFLLGLTSFFIVEILSGLALRFQSSKAYESVAAMHHSLWWPLQAFHYWSSSLLIATSFLFLLFLLWSERYRKPFTSCYLAVFLMFVASLGAQITGNLLPLDKHGVQSASIETSIVARVPRIGGALRSLALGADHLGPQTLLLWYRLHIGLAIGAVTLIVGLACRIRRSASPREAIVTASLLLALALITSFAVASPLGSPSSPSDISAFQDKASWYTWPLHGALMMSSRLNPSFSWIGAILIPAAFGSFLAVLPWLGQKLGLKLVRSVTTLGLFFFLIAAVGFGGSFDPLTGTRDPQTSSVLSGIKAPPIQAGLVGPGKQLFNSVGCSNCHGKNAVGGDSAPSLLEVYKAHPAGDYYMKYIRNPQSVDPNSTMPSFPALTQEQLSRLAEYLRSPNKP